MPVLVNKHLDGDGMIVFRHAFALGDGIVSKRLGSTYPVF